MYWGTGMRNLLHLTFQTNETSKPRKPKVMQTITDTLTKKAILRLLLRNSTLMTRSKKRNLYSIANGRMLLTVKRNGLQRKLQNQDTFITWKQSKQLTTKSIRLQLLKVRKQLELMQKENFIQSLHGAAVLIVF